jgi:thiamine pyrophosphate-dependent acetolactate synthase large subunit-like protein
MIFWKTVVVKINNILAQKFHNYFLYESFNKPKKNTSINAKIKSSIYKIKELLNKSKRPVLILGGGLRVAKAVNELDKFLKKIKKHKMFKLQLFQDLEKMKSLKMH